MSIRIRADAIKSDDEKCTLSLNHGEEGVGVAGSYIGDRCIVIINEVGSALIHVMMFNSEDDWKLWYKRRGRMLNTHHITVYTQGGRLESPGTNCNVVRTALP